jgi:hypothetical protein
VLPTAPPRLLNGSYGFTGTMAQYSSYGWWGTDASAPRGLGCLTNQYAAMPSLHVGWALWCGLILLRFGRHWPVRALGAIYPVVTVLVVLGTANHYLMDAAAGVLVMGIGLTLAMPALRFIDALPIHWGAGGRSRPYGPGAARHTALRRIRSWPGSPPRPERSRQRLSRTAHWTGGQAGSRCAAGASGRWSAPVVSPG